MLTRGSWLWRLGVALELICPHNWRPAKKANLPARWCSMCERSEEMTHGEFYAHFGRAFY